MYLILINKIFSLLQSDTMRARRFAFPSEIKRRTEFTENRETENGKTEENSFFFSPVYVNGGYIYAFAIKGSFAASFFPWFALHPRQWASRIFCSLSVTARCAHYDGFCFPLALRICNWREKKRNKKRGEDWLKQQHTSYRVLSLSAQ